jgi:hypothetical protein
MRHTEIVFIVPIGMVATLVSLAVGGFDDVLLALRGSSSHTGFLTRLWYGTALPGAGALFCAYFSLKARFTLIRIVALLTSIGMASRVAMTWGQSATHIRSIALLRLLVSGAFVLVCWLYGRRFQSEAQPAEPRAAMVRS